MTFPRLATPVWLALAGAVLFVAGRCSGPRPVGPSRDSLALATYAHALDSLAHASAARDSARARTVDSLTQSADSLRRWARIAARPRPRPVQPVGTAPDTIRWLSARVDTLEAQNDSLRTVIDVVIQQDSATIGGLREAFHGSQHESALLRQQLQAAADTMLKSAARIGELEHDLATARSGTHFGLVGEAAYAGGCWIGLAGLEAAQRGHFLFLTGEVSAAGGLGVGGCGRLPASVQQVQFSPAGRVALRVGI